MQRSEDVVDDNSRLLFIIFTVSRRYPDNFEPQSSPHASPNGHTSEKEGPKFLKMGNLNNSTLDRVISVTNAQLGGKKWDPLCFKTLKNVSPP